MPIDLSELILTGKISKIVSIGSYEFHLETPQGNQVLDVQNGVDAAVQYVIKIVNTKDKSSEEFTTTESRLALSKKLQGAQAGVLTFLINACNDLAKEQEETIRTLSKK